MDPQSNSVYGHNYFASVTSPSNFRDAQPSLSTGLPSPLPPIKYKKRKSSEGNTADSNEPGEARTTSAAPILPHRFTPSPLRPSPGGSRSPFSPSRIQLSTTPIIDNYAPPPFFYPHAPAPRREEPLGAASEIQPASHQGVGSMDRVAGRRGSIGPEAALRLHLAVLKKQGEVQQARGGTDMHGVHGMADEIISSPPDSPAEDGHTDDMTSGGKRKARLADLYVPTLPQVQEGSSEDRGGEEAESEPFCSSPCQSALLLKVIAHVTQASPHSSSAHFFHGLAHQRAGQPKEAAAAWERSWETVKGEGGRVGHKKVVQAVLARCRVDTKESEGKGKGMGMVVGEEEPHDATWQYVGVQMMRRGWYRGAVKALSAWVGERASPPHPDTLCLLGSAYLHTGHRTSAERCLQAVLTHDQNHPGAMAAYATLLLASHADSSLAGGPALMGKVEGMVRQLVRMGGGKAGLWCSLGVVTSMLGQVRQAQQCFDRAVAVEATNPMIQFASISHQADFRDDLHLLSEARVKLSGRVKRLRQIPAWLRSLTAARLCTPNRTEDTALSVRRDPWQAAVWEGMGMHAMGMHHLHDAGLLFRNAIARRPSARGWTNLGICLQGLGNHKWAEVAYEEALRCCGFEVEVGVLSNFGALKRQGRDFAAARRLLRKALLSAPTHCSALNNSALLLLAEEHFDAAATMFGKAVEANPVLETVQINQKRAEARSRLQPPPLTPPLQ